MNEPKWTTGPWGISSESPKIIKLFDFMGETTVIIGSVSSHPHSPFFPTEAEAISNALHFAAALDMALALEMIAAEADAGTAMIPSGLRLAIDAVLIKAGRKEAPEPVRHVTIAGMRDE